MKTINARQLDMPRLIDELVSRQKPGYTLEQPFYTDPEIFEFEKDRVLFRQWQFVDQISRIPNKGDYFLFTIAGEELIIVRGENDQVHAHFNVCRHRGSRICLEQEGNKHRLVCPYHAWTFELSGKLFNARQMPEDFDPQAHNLHSCLVKVFEGLIFVYLGKEEEAPDFDFIARSYRPWSQELRIADTKVAAIKKFPTPANWKLVIENFLECYHCRPSHPEYTAAMAHVTYDGDGTEKGMQKYKEHYDAWATRAKAQGRRVGYLDVPFPDQVMRASRQAIREGSLSTTKDGGPACNVLLGDVKEHDGGTSSLVFGDNMFLLAANDYITILHFKPVSVMETDVTLIYLVNAAAEEGRDYDVDNLTWLWEVTTEQDATIIVNNQNGILSDRYRPGPYSVLEGYCDAFVRNYLELLATEHRPTTRVEHDPEQHTHEDMWVA